MNRPAHDRAQRFAATLASLLAWLGLALAGCAAVAPAPDAIVLRNGSFEDGTAGENCAPGWACVMRKFWRRPGPASARFSVQDDASAAHGKVLCIDALAREPHALVSQSRFGDALRGRRIRLSLDVRVSGVEGRGAGVRLTARGGRGEALRTVDRLVHGTQDWQAVAAELEVAQGAASVDMGGVLEGSGKACFDNARVEVLP